MKPKFLALLVCVSAIAVLLPKAAIAETVRAELDGVEAALSYQPEDSICVSDIRLQIERDGDRVFDQEILGEEACRTGEGMLKVQNIGDDLEPEVMLDLYSGGAHCCTYSMIYRYNPTSAQYTSIMHPWGNVGYRLQDLDRDGTIEFVSADDRFAYAFGSFAGSSYPPQIWHYQQGQLVDVTRRYRQAVYDNAYQIWQTYTAARQEGAEVKAYLAAYLATKYLLGESADGWQRVQQAYQDSDRDQFFTSLRQFLRENGYSATASPTPQPSPTPAPPTPPTPTPQPSPTPRQILLQEEGTLEPGDSVLPSDNSLFDRFTFEGEAGDRISILLESTEFDTYLVLVDPSGASLAQNDDISQSDRNSRISIELPTSGTYSILANGYDSNSRGEYTLTVTSP